MCRISVIQGVSFRGLNKLELKKAQLLNLSNTFVSTKVTKPHNFLICRLFVLLPSDLHPSFSVNRYFYNLTVKYKYRCRSGSDQKENRNTRFHEHREKVLYFRANF